MSSSNKSVANLANMNVNNMTSKNIKVLKNAATVFGFHPMTLAIIVLSLIFIGLISYNYLFKSEVSEGFTSEPKPYEIVPSPVLNTNIIAKKNKKKKLAPFRPMNLSKV